MNGNDRMSKSYEGLEIIKASEIPEQVEMCWKSGVNLLIYGEPGCGKSSIIEELADKEGYTLIELGAASMCEEMVNGIPARDTATNRIIYAVPEWLERIMNIIKENPDAKIILFIDEITLADPAVKNALQILLTARIVPTHPDKKLPEKNVVIVAATNTAEDSTDGEELSRPLKTRFMSVRMTNSPADYEAYLLSIVEEKLPNIKAVLGDRTEQFIHDIIDDLAGYWCDNSKFYGTNPRTIMNALKMCNYLAGQTNTLEPQQVSSVFQRNTGHRLSTTNWVSHEAQIAAARKAAVKASSEIIPGDEVLQAMSEFELKDLLETIENSKIATTKAGISAMCKINMLITRIERAKQDN